MSSTGIEAPTVGNVRDRVARYILCALLVVLACWLLWKIVSTSGLVAAGVLWLAVFALTWCGIVKQSPPRLKHYALVGAIHALFLVELAACVLADYTVGGVESVRYIFVLLAILIAAVLCFFVAWRTATVVTVICGSIMLLSHIPEQIVFGKRLWSLHQEAEMLVRRLESERAQLGHYPDALPKEWISRPELRDHFSYFGPKEKADCSCVNRYLAQDDRFRLDYWVIDPGISYWYTPEGGWDYYDD